MATNNKKNGATTNGVNGHARHNGHVSLSREEYDAFQAREESFTEQLTINAKQKTRIQELCEALDAQSKAGSDQGLKVTHMERIIGLQQVFIDLLRADQPAVAAMADLSEFWRQWIIHTGNATNANKLSHAEAAKYEPNLFASWRRWVNDAGRADRTFVDAGTMTRAQFEAAQPKTVKEMQEHTIRRLREENKKLADHKAKLEAEIESYKNNAAKQPAQPTQGGTTP